MRGNLCFKRAFEKSIKCDDVAKGVMSVKRLHLEHQSASLQRLKRTAFLPRSRSWLSQRPLEDLNCLQAIVRS